MADTVQDQAHEGTVGDRLKAAREQKGLTLQEVAVQTRIPIRHLEHIELGEWDSLPAATYSVGFARSYAQVVGLEPSEVGAQVREQMGLARSPSGPVTAHYEPADPARVPPWTLVIVAIVIAALLTGGYFLWRNRAVDDSLPTTEITETPTTQPKAQPVQPRPAQPAAPATGPVVLTAIEDVWLRVDEPGGAAALYQGTLKAGERYEVPATAQAPQVRTGRPQSLRVTVGPTAVPPLGPPDRTISKVSLRAADLVARAQGTPPATGAAAAFPPPAAATGGVAR
ncbi:helix-turn-helix domain-containing protein [Sphingosinicella sp. BN140058]|uniref:helix-turn-helix domain-containing protein n=1 Tax=Sphingosinicella sp. BN140058 TaxID=1892855 RepID=UPI0010108F37|nr:helix-turn-helix domain-containing protein [Sphingosinicella sp. BN140058]QAY75680.1 helix-turn-helix domain-containing protein [Sphingosinicella sp. BN140058]